MKVPLSWLREFVDVPSDAAAVASRLASCGFEVASIEGDVIDFEITANRPDCLSVYGLAREAATAFDRDLKPWPLATPALPADAAPGIPVSIESDACGRYAMAVATVTPGPSPAWLSTRLTAAGVRPVNAVVDVTNYVMIEMGQPLHAFDAARLAGPEIHVRLARAGERLTTLDGQTRALDPRVLVIADRDRAVAVAGVMGGAASEVSAATTRVAIESAWFEPRAVRAASRRLALKTDASARFERGADPDAPLRALSRALALLADIGAGRAASAPTDLRTATSSPRAIDLGRDHLARLLGDAVPAHDVERILTRLGFVVAPAASGWRVGVPSFRVDVMREADLIEEVGRHWGFDRIPATFPELRSAPRPIAPSVSRDRRLRRVLCGAGLQEAATFTFIEQPAAAPFAEPADAIVAIANPLSEKFAVMRPSLLPALLDALIYNRRRETSQVRLFELGAVFAPAGEHASLGWVLAGARGDHWSAGDAPVDFFDAKGVAELVASASGLAFSVEPADDAPWFVSGRRARLIVEASGARIAVGAVGQIRPEIAAARGLGQSEPVFGGELDLAALARAASDTPSRLAPLPRYPSVVRDLSIVVDEGLPAAAVRGTIRSHAPSTLVSVREFDRYQGQGVPAGQVSLSVRLTFRDADRTLTDNEVQQAVDAIVAALTREHGATLRGGGK